MSVSHLLHLRFSRNKFVTRMVISVSRSFIMRYISTKRAFFPVTFSYSCGHCLASIRHARPAIRDIAMPPNKSNNIINSFFTLPHTCSAVRFLDIYFSSLPYQKKETKIPDSLFLKCFYNPRRNCFIDVQRHFEWNCGYAY